MKLNAATRLMAGWWEDLTPEQQQKYIEDHPKSEKAKEAKQGSKPAKAPDTEHKPAKKEPPKKEAPSKSEKKEPSEKKPKVEPKEKKEPPEQKVEKELEPSKADETEEKTEPADERKQAEQHQDKGAPTKPQPGIDKNPKQKPLAPGRPLAEFAAKGDDPSITVDKIYAQLKPEDAEEIKAKTAEAMALKASNETYVREGNYTPERKQLHKKIIDTILSPERVKAAMPKPGERPTFVVLGGRGGSGKSSFTHNEETGAAPTINEFDSTKFLTLDADAVKQMLDPPYEGWNANQVHEESSYLFDEIFAQAQSMGLNIISDATLKSDKMGPQLEAMQKQGYDIEGHYMYLPRQKAAQRACGRYLKDGPDNRGRLVPPEVILGNTNNEANFDKLKPFFKKWSAYNNDVQKGEQPQLIDHSDFQKTEARIFSRAALFVKTSYNGDEQPDSSADSAEKVDNMEGQTKYTADSWENDPFLGRTPERAAEAQQRSFANMRRMGIRTSQVPNPETRKAYTEYLRSVQGSNE